MVLYDATVEEWEQAFKKHGIPPLSCLSLFFVCNEALEDYLISISITTAEGKIVLSGKMIGSFRLIIHCNYIFL